MKKKNEMSLQNMHWYNNCIYLTYCEIDIGSFSYIQIYCFFFFLMSCPKYDEVNLTFLVQTFIKYVSDRADL